MLSFSIEPVPLAEGVPLVVWQASGISQEVRVMMPTAESIPVEPPPDKYPPPRGKYSCTWFPGTQDVLSGKSLGGVNVVTFCRRRVG